MKDLNYMSVAEEAINKIKKGAFLTVRAADALNTMTIGWATFGFIWQKPIMMVAVRSSRHTFGIIEKALDFTVTIPSGDMSKATAFADRNRAGMWINTRCATWKRQPGRMSCRPSSRRRGFILNAK